MRKSTRRNRRNGKKSRKNINYKAKYRLRQIGGALPREELIDKFMDFFVTTYMIMADKYEEERYETNKGFNKLNDIVSWIVSKELDFTESIIREAIKKVMDDGVSYEILKEIADMGEIKLTESEINNYFTKKELTENEEFLIQFISVGLGEQLESFNQYNIPPLTPPPSSPVAASASLRTEN